MFGGLIRILLSAHNIGVNGALIDFQGGTPSTFYSWSTSGQPTP